MSLSMKKFTCLALSMYQIFFLRMEDSELTKDKIADLIKLLFKYRGQHINTQYMHNIMLVGVNAMIENKVVENREWWSYFRQGFSDKVRFEQRTG